MSTQLQFTAMQVKNNVMDVTAEEQEPTATAD